MSGDGPGAAGNRGWPAPFAWPPTVPIGDCGERRRACVRGTVVSVRSEDGSGPVLTVTVADDTGAVALVFLGRRCIAGMAPQTTGEAEGMVGRMGAQLVLRNPRYRFVDAGAGPAGERR